MRIIKILFSFLLVIGCFSSINILNTPANQVYAQTKLTPKQVYDKYTQAQSSANLGEYRKYVSQALNKKTQTPGAEAMFSKLAQSMMVKNVEITGQDISKNTAILKATGDLPMSKRPAEGTITIVKENDEWKVDREEWVSKDKNSTQRFSVGVK